MTTKTFSLALTLTVGVLCVTSLVLPASPLAPCHASSARGPGCRLPAASPTPGAAGTTGNLSRWSHPSANPPAGAFSNMVYDAADHYTVLYGDFNAPGGLGGSSGTTTWELRNGAWKYYEIPGSPPARYGASMVYDALDRYVLLFGGLSAYSSYPMNDTWKFSAGSWTQLHPAHAPAPRSSAGMAYDARDGYVVLYGGLQTPYRHDTWKFAHGQWTQITNYPWYAGPPRGPVGMSYDSADHYVVMVADDPAAPGTIWNLTWEFRGGTWTNLTSSSTARPGFDYPPVLTDDPASGNVVLLGVTSASNVSNSTWTFAGGKWTLRSGSASPEPGYGPAVAYDPPRKSVLLLPGGGCTSPPFCLLTRNATWSFSNGSWSAATVAPSQGPPARSDAGVAEVPVGVLVFGGVGSSNHLFGDTWLFSEGFWVNLTPRLAVHPSPRYGMSMVWDPQAARVVLFGGTNGSHLFGDTWTYVWNTSGGGWHVMNGLVTAPSPRYHAAVAFAPYYNHLVLFGGTNGKRFFNDTWTLANGHWTNVATSVAPPARAAAVLAHQDHDPARGELTLVGGRNASVAFRDAWSLVGSNWSLDPGTSATPSPHWGLAVGFLASDFGDRAYVFGGRNGTALSNETWSLFFDNWTRVVGGTAPGARTFAGMAWDPSENAILLFGGLGPKGPLGDTWELAGA